MGTLKTVVIGLAVTGAAAGGWLWWQKRKASQGASTTLAGELTSPTGVHMMQLYAKCQASQCTQAEIASLVEYITSLEPDTEAERLWLQAALDELASMRASDTGVPLIRDPRYQSFFVSGSIHVGACGCDACQHNHAEKPCCEACAHGQPCTGACAAKKRQPAYAAAGRA